MAGRAERGDGEGRRYPSPPSGWMPPSTITGPGDREVDLLTWAITRPTDADFARELTWLAGVLEARRFPLEWLARGLELLAAALLGTRPDLADAAERIDGGAALVRARDTFLT